MGNHYLKWTPDAVRAEAAKHPHAMSFVRYARGAYNASHRYGIYQEISKNWERAPSSKAVWYGKWTPERVRSVAPLFSSRVEFQERCRGGYQAARKFGIVDEVCAHMLRRTQKWHPDTIAAEAAKYENRLAFARGSAGAYNAARTLGILDQVCAHMVLNLIADNNVVYIWRAKGSERACGTAVYKIGTTSERLGDKRIHECAAAFDFKAEIVFKQFVGFRATLIENFLLSMFPNQPRLSALNGYSEFRLLSGDDLRQAQTVAEAFAFASHP
ncbi:hypothetical protein N5C81_03760 [Rhizobium pusense]|uniref:hypothetical protein n=1 Tax=Agrobacterium pusense TaxID=648995 RepID=UPI00244C77D8|nr:hypothetical protein [Agrobacterium pusense]MDH1266731.1 hypothetical protein [Agrobacterium pusense]